MDIVEALKKTNVVQEAYRQYSLKQDFPISLEDLKRVVADYSEIKVLTKSVGYTSDFIHGRLERNGNEAEIVFSSELNDCYRRYVVTKELSHLIIDTDDSFTKDFSGLVTGLVDDSYQQIQDDDALQSENNAHFVACELLMPFVLRQGYIGSLESEDTTHYQIAKKHLIPASVVRNILRAPMHKSLQAIMAKVGEI